MDKFFERFKPKPNQDANKKKSGGGGFQLSLPGQKFKGEGQSLGGSKPGKVIEIQLHEPGPLGLKVERRPNSMGTAIVATVIANSQAEKAGVERGDILCFQGSEGQEEIKYDLFLELAKSNQRPLCFEVRRIHTKTINPNANGVVAGAGGGGNNTKNTKSAEAFSRQQAVIAAAEKREREAKARNKKTNPSSDKKNLPTLLSAEEKRKIEEDRLARMDQAVANQSEAAKEAVEAAKRNEARTAAQLGYNPYETNKVTAGQARNATVAIQTNTAETPDSHDDALPVVRPPVDPSANTDHATTTTTRPAQTPPVSQDFALAYEAVVTSNAHEAVMSSFAILRKLITNATTKGQGEDEAQAGKFRKVRLGNAKIKAAIVDVEGALDLMMSVGFQLQEENGESCLVYPKGFPGENWLPTALSMMEKYSASS